MPLHDDPPPQPPADLAPEDGAADEPRAESGDNPVPVAEAARADADAALAEQRDRYLRLGAEFDNFRKRAARERETAEHFGQSLVIRGLLEALDDLARFAHLDPEKTEAGPVIDGAAMVEQKLLKSLAGHGLEVVNPVGRPFDPAFHEAIATTPAATPDEDHLVAQVYQVGYVQRGQLLRPARVVVKQWTG